ncbi:rRNA N6-adenosine-methyltransferase ZCCHC4, partial [Chrysoperla carnea]|uniref:rRNA N6-adenosine-methyltransferase ZCCHC4 n=1 Tax=Chrysoperla carnea TaxID=189513 RepID=UPI001D066624
MLPDELPKFSDVKKQFWDNQRLQFLKQLPSHKDLFLKFHKIKQTLPSKRYYCHDCHELYTHSDQHRHKNHDSLSNISNQLLENPSKIFKPKDNAKKEAQYLFSDAAVKTIIDNIIHLKLRHIICIGAPRIHEYIQNNLLDQGYSSLLLDIDERFRHFFGPLQFCLYNSFNHYFFEGKLSETVFNDYLKTDNGNGIAIVTDPPFGGRIEALSDGIQKITIKYKTFNKISKDLPILWIFPYFMEPHILNSFPTFSMLDYKVDYDNHSLFTEKPSGRKNGSPVRIFTNITPSKFILPSDEGYKFCEICQKWVSQENNHCTFCNECTSKNGTTYKHCSICNRCVKPSWDHCSTCNRCCLQDHKCGQIEFNNNCFHCKLPGHKKNDCPNINKRSNKRKHSGSKKS